MNQFIAKAFGGILTFCHCVFLCLLIAFTFFNSVITSEFNLPELGGSLFVAGTAFLIYVIIFGMLSVLVSINEHLQSINKRLSSSIEINSTDIHKNESPRIEPSI